jgi:cobalt-zinc-cadmium efflux system outer membrane protein
MKIKLSRLTKSATAPVRCVVAFFLASLVILHGAARAEESAVPRPQILPTLLPPPSLVHQLVLQHPAVAAARAQLQAQLRRADIVEGGTHEFTARISQQSRTVNDPSERFMETQLSLERPVRLWGKSGLDTHVAEALRHTAQLAYADAMHETSRALLQLWLETQRSDARLDNARLQRELAQELDRQASLRLRQGDISRLDASLAQAELQRAQALETQALAAQTAARLRLQRVYPGFEFSPATRPASAQLLTAWAELPTQPTLTQLYLERSHALNLLRADAARLDLLARRVDRDRYPDPTVGIYAANERAGAERIVGVSLSIPLSGSLRRNQAAAAASDVHSSEAKVEQEALLSSAEVSARYSSLEPLIQATQQIEQAAQTQQEAAAKALRAYSLGEHSMTEVIQNRRLAAEQRMNALLLELDALESLGLLALDLHLIWDFDDDA